MNSFSKIHFWIIAYYELQVYYTLVMGKSQPKMAGKTHERIGSVSVIAHYLIPG